MSLVQEDATIRLTREVEEVGVVEEVVEILNGHHDGLLEREDGHGDGTLANDADVASAKRLLLLAALLRFRVAVAGRAAVQKTCFDSFHQ